MFEKKENPNKHISVAIVTVKKRRRIPSPVFDDDDDGGGDETENLNKQPLQVKEEKNRFT